MAGADGDGVGSVAGTTLSRGDTSSSSATTITQHDGGYDAGATTLADTAPHRACDGPDATAAAGGYCSNTSGDDGGAISGIVDPVTWAMALPDG
jgi:hypothetical protein